MSSKLFTILFFVLITFCVSSKLRKTKCVALDGDCDFTSYCCGDNECRDYRCAVKGTQDNLIPWAPEGNKCDWFHQCPKNYSCQSHRCIANEGKANPKTNEEAVVNKSSTQKKVEAPKEETTQTKKEQTKT